MAGKPAYVQTSVGPAYTRGDDAFVRDKTGAIKTVHANDVARLLDEDPEYQTVTAEDVAKRDVEIARSTLPEKLKTFGESAVAGAVDVPLIPIRMGLRAGQAAAGAVTGGGPRPAGVIDPDKLTGRAFVEGVAHDYGDASKAPYESDQSQAADDAYRQASAERREVNPGTATAGQLAGQLPWAFVGPGAAAGEVAAGLGFAGRSAVRGVTGALEGAAFGESAATDDAYIENKPLTAEKLMASMGWGALIGGAASIGLGAAGDAYGAGKGAVKRALGREAVTDETAAALGQQTRQKAATAAAVDPTDARIAEAADSAGLNPAARREAAQQEAQKVVATAKAADPTDWRKFTKEATPEAQYLHRDTVLSSASNETARDLTNVLDRQAPIYNEIDNLSIKRDKIAQHLAADGVDETTVIGRAQQETADLRARIAEQRAQVQARQAELGGSRAPDELDTIGVENTKYLRNGMREESEAYAKKFYEGASKEEAQAIALSREPVDVHIFPGEEPILQDGRHRLLAAKEAGAKSINARVSHFDGEGNLLREEQRQLGIGASKGKAPKASGAEKALREMDTIAADHERRILGAKSGADAAAEYDSLRRELSKVARGTEHVARTGSYEANTLMAPVSQFARSEYDRAAASLMDEGFVGASQAKAQSAVNNARVGSINGERYDLRPFVTQVGSETGARYGGQVYVGNQDAIRGMLGELGPGGGGMRADQFSRFVESQEKTLAAIRDNYALTPATAKKLDESLASLQKMRGSVSAANDAAAAVNRAKAGIEAEQIGGGYVGNLLGSTLVGGLKGGVGGAAKGFARGALGGSGAALRLQAAVGELATSEESKLAAWLEGKISKVTGTAGKGAAVVNQTANSVDGKVSASLGSFFDRIERSAGKAADGLRKPVAAARAAAAPTALRMFMGDDKNPQEAYRKRTEQLLVMNQNLGSGIRDRTTQALGGIAETAPRLTQHVAVTASRATQYLLDHVPVPLRAPTVMSPNNRPQPSELQIQQFAKRWAAVANPLTVLDDLNKGMVTYEQVDAIKNVYPELFQDIRVKAMQGFQRLDAAGIPVPYDDRLQADLMLDLNGAGDPTLDTGFALKVSGMMQAAKQQNSKPHGGGKPVNLAKSYMPESMAIGATLRGVS